MNRDMKKLKEKETKIWGVIPFHPSDLPAIGHFFKRNYTGPGTYGTMELFQWKIVDNYVHPGIILLIKDEDRIVSLMSATPKLLYLMGCEQQAAELCDALTDPSYRRQGFFALLDNEITKDILRKDIQFIYGTPNAIALPGHEKKANYKVIPSIGVKSLIIPLDVKHFIQNKCHWLIGKFASSIFSILVFIYFIYKRVFLHLDPLLFEEVKDIPNDWDDFWEKARGRFDFIIARNRQAMKWRYFQNPNKYRFYILKEQDRIIAFLVYRIIFDANSSSLVIADYLALPGRENDLTGLLFKALDDALEAGVTKINVWCTQGGGYLRVFKRFGFIERSEIPVITYQNDFARTFQEKCRRWHFTVGDSDNV